MPSTRSHHDITRAVFGDEYPEVHKLIDSSVQWPRSKLRGKEGLKGLIGQKSHRSDVVHQKRFWDMLLIMGKIDMKQYYTAILHFISDKVDTSTNHGIDRIMNPTFDYDRYMAKLKKKYGIK